MKSRGMVSSASGRLQDALEKLQLVWNETLETWNDDNARRFEEHHLRIIEEEIAVALPAISHLSQVYQLCGRECADPERHT